MRRIVTGHNKEGKSIINIDGPPARTLGEDVGGLYELWNTDGKDVNSLDSVDRANSEVILSPPAGGTKFRYFQINPVPEEFLLSSLKKPLLKHSKKWEQHIIELIQQGIQRCTKLKL